MFNFSPGNMQYLQKHEWVLVQSVIQNLEENQYMKNIFPDCKIISQHLVCVTLQMLMFCFFWRVDFSFVEYNTATFHKSFESCQLHKHQ